MGYKLTAKQVDLAQRWADGKAKPGERSGAFRVEGESLVYRGVDAGSPIKEIVGQMIPNGTKRYAVSNASRLEYACSTMSWGNRSPAWGEAHIQRVLREKGAIPVPFSVLWEAGISPGDVHIVEKAPAEVLSIQAQTDLYIQQDDSIGQPQQYVKPGETFKRHFVGAVLFEAKKGEGETVCYLFDIDRGELPYGIFNLFLVALPGQPTTIKEAYDSLKPAEVIKAEKAGKTVIRQGEYFFIPAEGITPPKNEERVLEIANRLEELRSQMELLHHELTAPPTPRGSLGKPGSRNTHDVEQHFRTEEGAFVSGEVTHSRREHHPITLTGWHKVVPNTATQSWTIQGDVD